MEVQQGECDCYCLEILAIIIPLASARLLRPIVLIARARYKVTPIKYLVCSWHALFAVSQSTTKQRLIVWLLTFLSSEHMMPHHSHSKHKIELKIECCVLMAHCCHSKLKTKLKIKCCFLMAHCSHRKPKKLEIKHCVWWPMVLIENSKQIFENQMLYFDGSSFS